MEQWDCAWKVTRMNRHSAGPIGGVVPRMFEGNWLHQVAHIEALHGQNAIFFFQDVALRPFDIWLDVQRDA